MLYDILPPLFLLTSFGGIAVIISRVVMRVQRDELSQHIKAQAQVSRTKNSDEILRSERGSKVSVVKNRLSLVPQVLKSTREQMRERSEVRRSRKEEKRRMMEAAALAQEKQQEQVESNQENTKSSKHIIQPQEGRMQRIRERMSAMVSRGREKVSEAREVKAQRDAERKQMKEEAQQIAASLKREETPQPQEQSKKRVTRRITRTESEAKDAEQSGMKGMLRRKSASKPNDPLQQAAVCLRESQFDQAEDILLPYIVQHARDVKAYMLLGRAALGRDDWDEAVEIFQQVKAIDETVTGLHACLGIAAARSGKMTLAVESLQKARDLEPENITIREELLNIAKRTDNNVLERSVTEELHELRQDKVPAEA